MTLSLSALVATAWTVVVPLLDDVPEADEVRPGLVSSVLMISLIVATVLLWFSLRRHLGRVKFDERLDDVERDEPDPTTDPTTGPTTGPVDEDHRP